MLPLLFENGLVVIPAGIVAIAYAIRLVLPVVSDKAARRISRMQRAKNPRKR